MLSRTVKQPTCELRLIDTGAPAVLVVPVATDGRPYALSKRLFDITVASVLLLVLSPLVLATALLVRLTSRGSVLFAQQRCGRGGRPFTCYKFRTMVDGAHGQLDRLREQHNVVSPIFKLQKDPRVTPLGRCLRKLSIDELPQAWNVLRGEMSLIGPRPATPDEVARYTPHQLGRLAVKPGMSGLWQVSGRSRLGFDEWVALDLDYIRRRGIWLDLWLALRTVPTVLRCRGAY